MKAANARFFGSRKATRGAWALIALAAISGCGGGSEDVSAQQGLTAGSPTMIQKSIAPTVPELVEALDVSSPATTCAALTGTQVAIDEFALPTRGAIVTSAVLREADDSAGLPQHCELQGAVLAASLLDPPIQFQVNLPTVWNHKAVQFGGGGLNGTVVTGADNVTQAPTDSPKPLARGYITFGSDSGHTGSPLSAEFGLNAQALANYSGESVKRTRDVAVALGKRYYGAAPRQTYYIGGSKGGQEAMIAAQRYGSDYAGVVAWYPAAQNQALVLNWFRMWEAAYRRTGGSLNLSKQLLLKTAVLETCDGLDGAMDGIVSNLNGCSAAFNVNSLRCPDGADTGDSCLSDLQIDTLNVAATPMEFAFPLQNAITSNGPFPVFNGGDALVNGYSPEPAGVASVWQLFFDGVIRYFIQQNPASTTYGFDYRAWQPRVEQISQLYDASNPNVDTFRAGGGKMIIVQGTTDMLVPHTMTTAYFQQVQKRYGNSTKSFAKYYVQPGLGHGGGDFNVTWDSLAALDNWVTQGRAPVNPVGTDGQRTRPLCEYPTWPKYTGGDINAASSYACVKN